MIFCFVLFIKVNKTKITIWRHFVHFPPFMLIILRLPLLDKLTKSSPCVTRQVYLFKTLVGAQLMAPVQRKAARSAEGWQIFCHFSWTKRIKVPFAVILRDANGDINITLPTIGTVLCPEACCRGRNGWQNCQFSGNLRMCLKLAETWQNLFLFTH